MKLYDAKNSDTKMSLFEILKFNISGNISDSFEPKWMFLQRFVKICVETSIRSKIVTVAS